MSDLQTLSTSLFKMLDEQGLVASVLNVIPADQRYVFEAWQKKAESIIRSADQTRKVIAVKRSNTRNGEPMWKCSTSDGTDFHIFTPLPTGWDLYKPEFMAMNLGDTIYWDDCPIIVRLVPDGKYFKPVWVEQRPEGSAPNTRLAFNASFIRNIFTSGFATIDFETTGLHADAEIIEIGIVFSDGRPSIHRFIKPENPIPAEATRVHRISNKDVGDSLPFNQVWAEIYPQLKDVTLVAWNAEFEEARLRYELKRMNNALPMPSIWCAMKAYAFGGSYRKLSEALREMGVSMDGRLHSGINDAQALLDLLKALKARVDVIDQRQRVMVGKPIGGESANSPDIDTARSVPDGDIVAMTMGDCESTEIDGGQ